MEFTEVFDHPDKPGEYLTKEELREYHMQKDMKEASEAAGLTTRDGVHGSAVGDELGMESVPAQQDDVTKSHPASWGGGSASFWLDEIVPEQRRPEPERISKMFSGDAEQRVGTEEGNISGAAELHLEDPARLSFEEIHPGKVYVPPKSAKDAAEYKARGNSFYKKKDFLRALQMYRRGLACCGKSEEHERHARSVLHSNRGACFLALKRNPDVVAECTFAIEMQPRYLKALMRRAHANEEMEQLEAAVADLRRCVEIDRNHLPAIRELARVEQKHKEQTEKMKDEMLGKLKDLGNMFLGNFGMSLDNFKMEQQDGGGYSVSYNPK